MSTQTFVCRLFGGRNVAVVYDNVANTLAVAGQSISITSLPPALQLQWANALLIANTGTSVGAFGGDNVSPVVGTIMDLYQNWGDPAQAAIDATQSGSDPSQH